VDQLLKILVHHSLLLPEMPHHILHTDIAIIIVIQVQEGFPNRYPVVLKLIFEKQLQLEEPVLDDLWLFAPVVL
jgi:hypothetical protein